MRNRGLGRHGASASQRNDQPLRTSQHQPFTPRIDDWHREAAEAEPGNPSTSPQVSGREEARGVEAPDPAVDDRQGPARERRLPEEVAGRRSEGRQPRGAERHDDRSVAHDRTSLGLFIDHGVPAGVGNSLAIGIAADAGSGPKPRG